MKRWMALMIIPAFFAVIALTAKAQPGGDKNLKEEILELINQHRKEKHLAALQMNDDVSEVCEKHSKNMAKGKVAFGHDGFENREVVLQKKVSHTGIAENVAEGHLDAKRVVELWLNSTGHRKNIEGNYDATGIGLAEDKDGAIFFTMIFLKTSKK